MNSDSLRIPLELPGGVSIRLTGGRAQQHQRRASLRFSEDADLQALAPVIDVELYDAEIGQYRYGGMSLADLLNGLQRRSPASHARVLEALGRHRNELALLAEHVTTTALEDQLLVLPKPPYLSALVSHLCTVGPSAGSVAQWRGILASAPSRGVSSKEIAASGMVDRLAALADRQRLARKEVLARVGLSHVVPRMVSEVRVGFLTTAGWKTVRDPVPLRRWRRLDLIGRPPHAVHEFRFRHRGLGWAVIRSRYHDLFTADREAWSIVDHKGQRANRSPMSFPTARLAMSWAEAEMARRFASWPLRRRQQRWKERSLIGAAGYEELLLQLDSSTEEFWSPHYEDVRNVLVHMRVSRHDVADGRRVLFIDEVQSDWVSAWSMDRESTPAPTFHAEWVLLALKTLIWWAQCTGCAGVAFSTPELQRKRWYRPPSVVYERTLPAAAATVAKLLELVLTTTEISEGEYRVELDAGGWRLYRGHELRLSRAFESRAAAERLARHFGTVQTYEVPVIWIDKLAPIVGVPLFGAGSREMWVGRAGE